MATTFKFYKDAALSQEYVSGVDELGPVSSPPTDFVVYLGSTDATRKLQAKTNPGVDPVQVTIADADIGNDLEASDIKLATTNAGLAAAVAGDPLDLPHTINGGAANHEEVHVRVAFAAGGIADDNDVTLNVSADETPI